MNNEFKVGDKVIHVNHGSGIIKGFTGDPTSAIVKLDKDKGWGDELELSISCLKKVK